MPLMQCPDYHNTGTHFNDLGRMTGWVNPTWCFVNGKTRARTQDPKILSQPHKLLRQHQATSHSATWTTLDILTSFAISSLDSLSLSLKKHHCNLLQHPHRSRGGRCSTHDRDREQALWCWLHACAHQHLYQAAQSEAQTCEHSVNCRVIKKRSLWGLRTTANLNPLS